MTSKLGSKKLLNASFGYLVEKRSYARPDPFAREGPANRWVVLVVMLIIFSLVGIGKLADLQLISGSYYRALAEGNRIRRVPIKAPRGEILDRNGKPLARNIPVYKLATFTTGGVVEKTQIVERDQAFRIQAENAEEASRLLIDVGREYTMGEVAAHVVGYVNETAGDELGKQASCHPEQSEGSLGDSSPSVQNDITVFQLGDLIGRMGVEQYYDCLLRGINGEELIEVDARGRLVRRLGRREAVPGETIKLTIDSDLQQVAFESLKSAPDEKGLPRTENSLPIKGAMVLANPQNGETLALVSVPSFNSNEINQRYREWAQDPDLPFFNRAIAGAYHPGSTFKIVTSVASLEDGVLDENFKYTDIGFVEAGGLKFRNWYFVRNGRGEGEMNIVRAITRSTDTFFYIAGEKVGIDSLARWAGKLGIGKKSGIDLPGEVAGLMPTPEWKLEAKGERWFLGNTYNTSIGQGDVAATPVQISQLTSVIASNGKLCRPHVLNQEELRNFQCEEVGIRQENIDVVKEGMRGACLPGGTAGQFFSFEPRVACKTGTAEVGTGTTHAWFTAFASVDNPEITITAVIEEGGEGSTVAAPVVKKIMQKYFER